ncbi:FUSC family protein [Brevundimonas sp. GCM10030266]|uniref:FUSC family protein n=1 Tax=Brevundimonas sp. GCM10030266 TaxID=3273386 RepID=UPI003622807D
MRALSPRRAAEVRAALQMAVGAVVAFYLATAFKLPHPYWSVISAIVVIQASVGGGVLTVARDRAVGTLVGAMIGGAAAFVRPEGVNWMMATLAACTAGLAFFATGRPWLKVAPVTAAIVIAGAAGPEGPAQLALDRVLEILVGSGVGVVSILLLFPRHARQTFRLQAREAAAKAAEVLELVIRGEADVAERLKIHADLKKRLDALGQAASNVIDLPGAQKETADRAALVRTFWRVRSDIVILGRGFQAKGALEHLGPWALAATAAVERLQGLSRGQAVEALDDPDPALKLGGGEPDGDLARGAAAIGLVHMHRDLNDLIARFRDLHLI